LTVHEARPQALGEGAARAAPTAPHATPRQAPSRRNGPERFWAKWPVRVALALSLVISTLAHCSLVPFEMPRGFEIKEVEGEAAIPVDLFRQEDTPPLPPPAPPESRPDDTKPDDTKAKEGTARATRVDAGPPRDAGGRDASAVDGSGDAAPDGEALGLALDGALAVTDASGPPRDPEAIVGAIGAIQADVVLVMLVVNAEVIRTNVAGARMGYLLRGIPQWDEFMSGTDIDPVRDTDWVIISGPSLVNTARDVVLIHYSVPDAVVERAIHIVSRRYDRGGPIDAGVRGVKASLAHADRAERVLLRAQPHLVAVVPPGIADKVARQLVTGRVQARLEPDEALYLRLVNPHHPFPEIPEAITELRMRVVARADQGADVFVDGDTKDPDTATRAAAELARVVRSHNDALTSILTHGLFDHTEVGADGNRVTLHLTATLDHVETLMTLVGGFLGVQAGGSTAQPATSRSGSSP
jgi:hypothetical protein